MLCATARARCSNGRSGGQCRRCSLGLVWGVDFLMSGENWETALVCGRRWKCGTPGRSRTGAWMRLRGGERGIEQSGLQLTMCSTSGGGVGVVGLPLLRAGSEVK